MMSGSHPQSRSFQESQRRLSVERLRFHPGPTRIGYLSDIYLGRNNTIAGHILHRCRDILKIDAVLSPPGVPDISMALALILSINSMVIVGKFTLSTLAPINAISLFLLTLFNAMFSRSTVDDLIVSLNVNLEHHPLIEW